MLIGNAQKLKISGLVVRVHSWVFKFIEGVIVMLVLSRQKDESIMIGDNVEITIVDVRGDKVRLGITAPREIAVHRKEVFEAIKREEAEKNKK